MEYDGWNDDIWASAEFLHLFDDGGSPSQTWLPHAGQMQQTNRQMKQANKQTNGGGITISFLFHLLWEGTPQIHSFANLQLLSIHLSALFGISFHVLIPHWWGVPSDHETCL